MWAANATSQRGSCMTISTVYVSWSKIACIADNTTHSLPSSAALEAMEFSPACMPDIKWTLTRKDGVRHPGVWRLASTVLTCTHKCLVTDLRLPPRVGLLHLPSTLPRPVVKLVLLWASAQLSLTSPPTFHVRLPTSVFPLPTSTFPLPLF